MAWWMNISTLLVVCLLMNFALSEEKVRGRKERGGRRDKARKKEKCSDWSFSDCAPAAGKCGKGTKIGSRDGEDCMVKQRTFKCVLPCPRDGMTTTDPAAVKPVTGKRGNKGKKNICKYRKSDWSDCDAETGTVTRTLTLKKGDATSCEMTKTQTKRCKNKNNKGKNSKRCKYSVTAMSDCDSSSDTQNVTLSVREGSPSTCEAMQVVTRKCKRTCKYTPGNWSACDTSTNLVTRVDSLNTLKSKGSDCKPERTVSKLCKPVRIRCKYEKASWSDECDEENERTLTRKLLPGEPEGCEPEKVLKKSCTMKTGRDRCFFGPWAAYGPCQNGVRTKIRPLISGGEGCQRKAVKTKMCV